jgi:tetratricopeptide (TPR) repeat protein
MTRGGAAEMRRRAGYSGLVIVRRLALAAAAAALAAACVSTTRAYDRTPEGLRLEVARRVPGVSASDVVIPFDVDDATVERARQLLAGAEAGREVDALVAALTDPSGFGLRYEWATSGTAKETLERGAGNCLALSSTLIGIARRLGMRASYLEVITADPTWVTDGDIIVQADHIAAIVTYGKQRLYVDYSGRLPRARRIRAINDLEALAHFYNNRGYELLHHTGTGDGEPAWEEAAEDFFLATRVDPANVRALNNLGVSLARRGDDARARAAYERALELDPANQSAHLNLVALFVRAGEIARAQEHLEAARKLDPRNPQIERLAKALTQAPPPPED